MAVLLGLRPAAGRGASRWHLALAGTRGFAEEPLRRIDGYLHYYGKLKNQEGMLRDRARVEGYKAGIEAARPLIEGKTVMDIGTGSGVLAFFAAQAGAKKVYAVDGSPSAARLASRLSRANGFVGTVEVVPRHLEEISEEDIPKGSVDVIVSELFSHFLVGELGLHAVTIAKQRFLRPGGLILPETAVLKLSPFEDKALGAELRERHQFWMQRDYYGLDLTAALPIAQEQMLRENIVDVVAPDSLLTPPGESPAQTLDLAGPDDPKVWDKISFELEMPKRAKDSIIDGFVGWWDCIFSQHGQDPAPVLSTGPDAPLTVWAQTRFLLDKPMAAAADAKLTVKCVMKDNRIKESYILWLECKNHATNEVRKAGPIELNDVYARQIPKVDGPADLFKWMH